MRQASQKRKTIPLAQLSARSGVSRWGKAVWAKGELETALKRAEEGWATAKRKIAEAAGLEQVVDLDTSATS